MVCLKIESIPSVCCLQLLNVVKGCRQIPQALSLSVAGALTCEIITITSLCNKLRFGGGKNGNFQLKKLRDFSFFANNKGLGHMLEPPFKCVPTNYVLEQT